MRSKYDRPVTKIVKKTSEFFEQFRGKRMTRIILIYAGGSIALIHFFELVFKPILDLNVTHSIVSLLAVMVLAGFPIILLFAWATNPARKTPGPYSLMKLSIASALSLVLLLVSLFIFSRFIMHHEEKRMFSILPFKENTGEEKIIADKIYKKIMREMEKDPSLHYLPVPASALDSIRQEKLSLKKWAQQNGVNTFIDLSVKANDQGKFEIGLMLTNEKGRKLLRKEDRYEINAIDIFELETNQLTRKFARKLNEWSHNGKWNNEPAVKMPKSQARRYADTAFKAFNDFRDSLALENFTKALEVDPSFALAYFKIAQIYFFECMDGMSYRSRRLELGKKALDRLREPGVVLDNEDAGYHNIHLLLGDYYTSTYQFDSACDNYFNAYNGDVKSNELCGILYKIKIKSGQWDSANYYADKMFKNIKNDLRANMFKMRMVLSQQKWDNFSSVANDYWLALNKATNREFTVYNYNYYKYVFLHGFLKNLDGARRLIKNIDSATGATSGYEDQFNQLNIMDNNFDPVIEDLKPLQSQYFYEPDHIFFKGLLLAQVYLYAHKVPESEKQFMAAATILSSIKKGNEDDFRWHQSAGLAYAGLGKKKEAMQEADLALLLNTNKGAEEEVAVHIYRAMIFATLAIKLPGEKNQMADLCIRELTFLSSKPGVYNGLRFYFPFKGDPLWDGVKHDPRFDGLWERNYLKLVQ